MRGGEPAGRSPLPHPRDSGRPWRPPPRSPTLAPSEPEPARGRAAAARERLGGGREPGVPSSPAEVCGSEEVAMAMPSGALTPSPVSAVPQPRGRPGRWKEGPLPPDPRRLRNSARTPGCRPSGSEDPSKVKPARGAGAPGREPGEPRERVGAVLRAATAWVPGGVHGARSGIPERSAPSLRARPQLGALLSDLLRLDLGGGCRPRSPGTRPAGECAKAAGGRRGVGLGGEFAASGPGEGGGSPSCLRGGGKAARGPGRPAAQPGPAGRGAAKLPPALPVPSLVCRLRSLAGLGGRGCEMGTQAVLSERFRPRPGPGTQRAGPAVCWFCGVRAGPVPS